MLSGTFCRLSVRFCAVTTTSSREPEDVASWAWAVLKQATIADANGSALASKKCRRGCDCATSDRMLQRIFRCLLLVII
jgi:hypothetical protein